MTASQTTYAVEYTINAPKYPTTATRDKVVVMDDYSSFGDIPNIIALRRGVTASQVHIVKLAEIPSK